MPSDPDEDRRSRRAFLGLTGVCAASTIAGCSGPLNGRTSDVAQRTEEGEESTDEPSTIQETNTPSDSTESTSDIQIVDVSYGPVKTTIEDIITISIQIENIGNGEGREAIEVFVDSTLVYEDNVALEAGERREIEAEYKPIEIGPASIGVNGEEFAEFVVVPVKNEESRTVGAHYYAWYGSPPHVWRDGKWSLESPFTPKLGNYDAGNPAVVERHIDWCHIAGIDWLLVNWVGRYTATDRNLQETIFDHPRSDELSWSLTYDAFPNDAAPYDLSDSNIRFRFINDLEYIAREYMTRDTYKTVEGRPVLFFWIGYQYYNGVEDAIREAFDGTGVDPYIIVDIRGGGPLSAEMLNLADAFGNYNMYTSRPDIEEIYLNRCKDLYEKWTLAEEHTEFDVFWPVIPGFNDSQITHVERDNPVLEPTPERYQRSCDLVHQYADGPVIITSFNEWYESTQIEPSEKYGREYLRITRHTLAVEEQEPPELEYDVFELEFEEMVRERELNPDAAGNRLLAMLVSEMIIRSSQGHELYAFDIGGPEKGFIPLRGAFGKERSDDSSWRWFGGGTTTLITVPDLPESGEIVLKGSAGTSMSVNLLIDDTVRGTGSVDTTYDQYPIEF